MSGPKQIYRILSVDVVGYSDELFVRYLLLAFFSGDVQSSVHVLCRCIDSGSVLQQQHYDVDVA